ncbi:MAG: hypothetical protein LBT01_00185 [Spirochaetaceae bacterium]|nr:hypothetical protein [Spirochaetaceae bacterium]
MTIQQTIEIPADRRVYFDVPREIPAGVAEVAIIFENEAAAKTAKRVAEGRRPFEGLRGSLQNSGLFSGDPVKTIRKMRDEW